MFGHRYFGAAYFGPRYFGPAIGGAPIVPVVVGGRVRHGGIRRKKKQADWANDPAWKNVELAGIADIADGPATPEDDALILHLLAWDLL